MLIITKCSSGGEAEMFTVFEGLLFLFFRFVSQRCPSIYLISIYRSSKLLLCNNTEIWSRKHGCNPISEYCQLPEWRCSYFYYDIHYVSIKELFSNQFQL